MERATLEIDRYAMAPLDLDETEVLRDAIRADRKGWYGVRDRNSIGKPGRIVAWTDDEDLAAEIAWLLSKSEREPVRADDLNAINDKLNGK